MEEITEPKSIKKLSRSDVNIYDCPECPNGLHIGLDQHEVSIKGWNDVLDIAVKDSINK
jgi:hypothetical protein